MFVFIDLNKTIKVVVNNLCVLMYLLKLFVKKSFWFLK